MTYSTLATRQPLASYLDTINEDSICPDLSDLFFYDTTIDRDTHAINEGDVITIECVDGFYRSGQVYAFGKSWVSIIGNNGKLYRAHIDADVELHHVTAHNAWLQVALSAEGALANDITIRTW